MKQVTLDNFIKPDYGDELAQTIQDIDALRADIDNGKMWNNPEMLSRAAVKLAILNSFLGEFVASAFYDAATTEGAYKTEREKIKLSYLNGEVKTTASEAESRKYSETSDQLEAANRAAYIHKLLQIKRTDTSELIDAIRSRLSYIKKEQEHTSTVT